MRRREQRHEPTLDRAAGSSSVLPVVLLAVVGFVGCAGLGVLAAPPMAHAQTIGGVVIDPGSISWSEDGTLSFSWTDPPPPEDGTSWQGGVWAVDADGNQICTDYLADTSQTSFETTCAPTLATPGGTAYLHLQIAGTGYDEYAESEWVAFKVPGETPSSSLPTPSSSLPTPSSSQPTPSSSSSAPPTSSTSVPMPVGPLTQAATFYAQLCQASDPFNQYYLDLQAQLKEVKAKESQTQRAMTKLENENEELGLGTHGAPKNTTLAQEVVIGQFQGLLEQSQGLLDKISSLEAQVRAAAPGAAQVAATCEAGARAALMSTPVSPVAGPPVGPPQAVQGLPGGGQIAQAQGTRAFVQVPWFVDIQSGAMYWSEHVTHFNCPFGWQAAAKASFTIQRCHYVSTPEAAVALQGTALSVEVSGTTTTVKVFAGKAAVSDLRGAKVVELSAGQMTTVQAGQPPAAPSSFDAKHAVQWWRATPWYASTAFVLLVVLGVLMTGSAALLWRRRGRLHAGVHAGDPPEVVRKRALVVSGAGTFGPWLLVLGVLAAGGAFTSRPSATQVALGAVCAAIFVVAPIAATVFAIRILRAAGVVLAVHKTSDARVRLAESSDEARMHCQRALVDEGFHRISSDPSGMMTARRRSYGQFTASPIYVWVRPENGGSVVDVHCKATAQSLTSMIHHPSDVLVDRLVEELGGEAHAVTGPGNGTGGNGHGNGHEPAIAPGPVTPAQLSPDEPTGVNRFAVAAFVLGVLWLFWLGSILAVVFGHVALHQIRRRPGRGRGLAIAGAVLGWAAIAIFVAAMVAVLVAPPEDQKSAAQIVRDGVSASQHASSVHMTGTMYSSDTLVQLDVVISRTAVGGTLTEGDARVDLVVSGGNLYLRGNAAFWSSQGAGTDLALEWVKMPESAAGISSLTQFTQVFDRLKPQGALTKEPGISVHGQRTVPVSDSSGTVIYVADSGTPYILSITHAATAAHASTEVDFDHYGTAPLPAVPTGVVSLPVS